MAVSGCGAAAGDHPRSSPEPPEKPDLTVAAVPAVDSAGFFIALQRGLFAAQGLHIKYVPAVSSETVIPEQEKGQYDVTIGNYVSYIQAQAADPAAGLEIVGAISTINTGSQGVYVRPRSGISSISQLAGTRIAINAPRGIAFMLVASVLSEYGVPLSSIHWSYLPFPAMAAALTSGHVQAVELPEPFASQDSDSMGLLKLFDANQGATSRLPIEGYVVTRSWARRYPRTLAAFRRALAQGQRIAGNNRAAVDKALEQFAGASPVTAGVMALNGYPLTINEKQLQQVPTIMLLYGLLKRPFQISSMLAHGLPAGQ